MRCILINPPTTNIVRSAVPEFISKSIKDNPSAPLGLMSIAAYAEKHCTGWSIEIVDLTVEYALDTKLIANADVVGISVTTLTLYDALKVARQVKKIKPSIKVILGGPHCSVYPTETEIIPYVDYVFVGDGEIAFAEFLSNSGNYYKKLIFCQPVQDLDKLPYPSKHLVKLDRYYTTLSGGKTASIVTSRGCPFNCSFCHSEHQGRKWRARSAKNIVDEILEYAELGITEIEIYDDTFTYDPMRVSDFCGWMILAGNPTTFSIRTRVDCVNLEMLQELRNAGCRRVNFGIESFNPSVLKTLRKGQTVEQIKQAVKWAKQAGLKIQAYLMIGSPHEDKESILNTISEVNKLGIDYVYYSITTPLPGTAMYREYLQNHHEDYWLKFVQDPVPNFQACFYNEKMRDELLALADYGFKSFYNKRRMIKEVLGVRSIGEFKRKALVALEMMK